MAARTWGIYQLVLVSWCVGTLTADVFDADTESKVRSYIRETMDCRNIPGITAAVIKDNATWTSGFGFADIDTDRPVDSQSLFGIGSLTKAFTMTLLGILLDEHGYTWSSKVSEIKEFEFKFIDDLRTSQTTIKDMLSHRTGLATLDIGLFSGYSRTETTRAGLTKRLQFLPATYEFRDRWHYNNYLYMLLAHIGEVLGGDTWENLLKTRLLSPIGMTSTFVLENPRDLLRDHVAKPYIYSEGRFLNGTADLYNIFPDEPAGAIMSSATDMIKWIRFNMNGGKTETGVQLLKKEMLAEAIKTTTPFTDSSLTVPEFPVSDTQIGYGYAWFAANYRGYHRYWHSGGLFSYVTYLWVFPEMKLGLFASVNGPAFDSGLALRSIFYYVSDILLEEEPWLNETTTCSYPEPWHTNEATNTSAEENGQLTSARDYEGVYGHPLFPDVKITVQNEDLDNLRLEMGRISGQFRPTIDKDRLLLEITHPWEIARSYIDSNNVTKETNVTFTRSDGVVKSADFSFEVNLTFSKGISITDAIPISGALSPIASYILVNVFVILFYVEWV